MLDSALLEPILWKEPSLHLLDQRLVPGQKTYLICNNLTQVISAIHGMAVRGAPAIAIAGAYGLAMEIHELSRNKSIPDYSWLLNATQSLQESRPTAVNLSRMIADFLKRITPELWTTNPMERVYQQALDFAQGEFQKDIIANRKIGQNALSLFSPQKKELHILTHCNTGALATAGHGTALGIIRSLRDAGFQVTVYADETRPYLQGSRLTAFEMQEEGIPCFIITDGMPAWLMNDRRIDAVVVGCDRIAGNGDTANKIGTRGLAIIARECGVPFYVAATRDSFDLGLSDGSEIPIEMRKPSEVTSLSFLRSPDGEPLLSDGILAPPHAKALNPSFDVTPARYITKIVSEMGVWDPKEIRSHLG